MWHGMAPLDPHATASLQSNTWHLSSSMWPTAGVGRGRVEAGSQEHMEVLVDVAEQVNEALQTMHRNGYVHFDVKVCPTFMHSANVR